MNTQTDEQIVEKICNGNLNLYSIIIERYQNKLLRYTHFMINNTDQCADIVQESFVKAYINLKGFDTKRKFSSWLYKIVHNETLNYIKKHKKQVIIAEDFDVPSDENIEEDFDKQIDVQKMEECLKQIHIKYSEPLILFYFEQKSYTEISEILRMPEGTVATRINRAKKIIKNICQKK